MLVLSILWDKGLWHFRLQAVHQGFPLCLPIDVPVLKKILWGLRLLLLWPLYLGATYSFLVCHLHSNLMNVHDSEWNELWALGFGLWAEPVSLHSFFGCIVGNLDDTCISATITNAYLKLHGQLVTVRKLMFLESYQSLLPAGKSVRMKTLSLFLPARRFNFSFCRKQMKHTTESLCSL